MANTIPLDKKILASASQDLIDGYRFPERQAASIGSHLLNSNSA